MAFSTTDLLPELTIEELIDHWIKVYMQAELDVAKLRWGVTKVYYEEFVNDPHAQLGEILRTFGVSGYQLKERIRTDTNKRHYHAWSRIDLAERLRLIDKFENRCRLLGYDIRDYSIAYQP